MYIISQDRNHYIETKYVWVNGNGVVAEKPDGKPRTVGAYDTENEAKFVLRGIFEASKLNKPYMMPPNVIGRAFPFVNDPEWIAREAEKEGQNL